MAPGFDLDDLKSRATTYFSIQREVRLQEVDAAGIVFFARVLEYTSDAFVSFCRAQGIDLARVIRHGQWSAPLRHVAADYLRPLVFGDESR